MPGLVRIRDTLRAAGASPALLSGSGSALFGVFPTEQARARARDALGFSAADARVIDTFTASPGAVAPPETRR
jgi:4-diphosphocytidyl-2C-methyl-D-erythritol kinase